MPPVSSLTLSLTAPVHNTDTGLPKAVKLKCFLCDAVYCLRKNPRGFRIAEHQPPRAQSLESSTFTFDNGDSDDLKAKGQPLLFLTLRLFCKITEYANQTETIVFDFAWGVSVSVNFAMRVTQTLVIFISAKTQETSVHFPPGIWLSK